MKKLISTIISKIGGLFRRIASFCYRVAKQLYTPPQTLSQQNMAQWFEMGGDVTLRVDYDTLGPDSTVVDVGGYEGDWAAEIAARYGSNIHVFEPVSSFVNILEKRFGPNPHIHIHPFGLGGQDQQPVFNVIAESSTLFEKEKPTYVDQATTEQVSIRAFKAIFEDLGIDHIDLIKINIEGGEYELLEHFLDIGWIHQIDQIQVQFHDFVPGAEAKMNALKSKLSETHELTYEYIFVWENWKRKGL